MGLDIYTYTKVAQEASDAHDARWNMDSDSDESNNPFGKPYVQWSEDEKRQYRDESSALPGHQDVPSKDYPGNINNRRYLRSSYNAGGFNRVVPEVTGRNDLDYYGILSSLMDGGDDEYLIKVDDPSKVVEARKKALECVDVLSALQEGYVYRVDSIRAQSLRPQDTDGPMSDGQALRIFHEQRQQHEDRQAESKNPFGGAWGGALGDFWLDKPLEVAALMPGVDILGAPCVHAIYRTKLHESYLESAKVLVEFCDELLDLIKQDGCAYIHWSG